MTRLPTFFLSHGGGPWPWMDGPFRARYAHLEASLAGLPASLPLRPKAVLMVSAHWEERAFSVQSGAHPGMVYDYGGFPPHTYRIVYPAPGAPELAARVAGLIEEGGLPAALDAERGYDHGAYCAAYPMYPQAEVPMLQLSLRTGLDPAEHLALGRLLAPLRDEGVLIIGSGFSFHNLRLLGEAGRAPSAAFDGWLQQAVPEPAGRAERLMAWAQAPAARIAHPREEHLLPLMVAAGAAEGDAGVCNYRENELFGAITTSSFRFG